MKKLLIIKTGPTLDNIREKYGDFEDMIINNAGLDKGNVKVWSVFYDKAVPGLEDVSAIIITGSHAMVTDYEDWSVMLSNWLIDNASKNIPTLGICYGHQLLADTLGGVVDYHPKGQELGTVKIELTEEGKRDPLLGHLPEVFLAHVAHSQTVLKLPVNARILAKNSFDSHHAFALNNHIWGVQFHPEFNAGVTASYIEEIKGAQTKDVNSVMEMEKSVQEHHFGKILLKRFIELANSNL